jgi:hypothetical protein
MITQKNKWTITIEYKDNSELKHSIFAVLPKRTNDYKTAIEQLDNPFVQSVSLELDLNHFNRNQTS